MLNYGSKFRGSLRHKLHRSREHINFRYCPPGKVILAVRALKTLMSFLGLRSSRRAINTFIGVKICNVKILFLRTVVKKDAQARLDFIHKNP